MSSTTAAKKVHPFEAAGLGLAPFRCIGHERRVGPIRLADGAEVGAPGQPMGTCDYCGIGIADCYVILSSDGKRFVVGCDCVARTSGPAAEDAPDGFVQAKRQAASAQRADKKKRDMRSLADRVTAAHAALAANPTLFADQPHPFDFHARAGKTRRDYYTWLLSNGSEASRRDTVRKIEEGAGDALPSAEQVAAFAAGRAAERQAEAQAAQDAAAAKIAQRERSQFIGREDERISVANVTVEKMINVPGVVNGMPIHKTLVIMRDADGNRLIWWTQSPGAIGTGDRGTMTATVKAHETYQGERQTVLRRVKLDPAPAAVDGRKERA